VGLEKTGETAKNPQCPQRDTAEGEGVAPRYGLGHEIEEGELLREATVAKESKPPLDRAWTSNWRERNSRSYNLLTFCYV
jgi:hypothetical protein